MFASLLEITLLIIPILRYTHNRFTLSLGSIQASYEGYIDAIYTAFPHKHVKET